MVKEGMIMKGLYVINSVWRLYCMYKQTMNFAKGIGTGIIAGIAVASVSSRMMKGNKRLKRNACKTMSAMSSVLDNVEYMLK